MGCVESLAALVGLTGQAGREFDWETVEAALGVTLPNDYKALAELFPQGRFQGSIGLIRPGDVDGSESDFLGYYAHRLDDMRRWREDEPERFPFPIYPEAGGLLPWGTSHRGDLFFWLTESADSNTWPVVASDVEFEHWEEIPKAICEFLVEVVSGRFVGPLSGIDLAARGPWFQEAQPAPQVPPPSRKSFWIDLQMWPEYPGNKFATLVEMLGSRPGDVRPVDWSQAEQHLGLRFPSDYKAFIDAYGPGTFGDITIAAPGASPAVDLYDLILNTHQRAAADVKRTDYDAPIFPEPGGMIPWGSTFDGWTCCWAPSDPDPDQWGTVILEPSSFGFEYSWEQSFSALLVKYADPEHLGLFVGRDAPRLDHVSFTPHKDEP